MTKEMTLARALIDYFGPDRKVEISEMKELSQEDKAQFKEMLEGVGYKILPAAQ